MIFFAIDWEKITSYEQKHFRETNNPLCKVSAAWMTRKQNDRFREISFSARDARTT